MSLLNPYGQVSAALARFARRHGLDNIDPAELSDTMQERWLRKTEHQYQVPPGPPGEDDLNLLREMGMVDAVWAPAEEFADAAVFGGTVVAVRKRLRFLALQRARFEKVYLLGSGRKLDPAKEGKDVLCNPAELPFRLGWPEPAELPETEAGMMRLVFGQSQLPDSWEAVSVCVLRQPGPGGLRDPNTAETVAAMFANFSPDKGPHLFVSSQPFIQRQALNAKSAMGPGNVAITIGYEAPSTIPLKTYLDEVARLLYEELGALAPK